VLKLDLTVTGLIYKKKKTPLDCYEEDLKRKGFIDDPAQRLAVEHTQRLFDDLVTSLKHHKHKIRKGEFLNRILGKREPHEKPLLKGLYFWGGVGRGKTYLVDTFYNCLPFKEKKRIHFHSFMQNIHNELKSLKNVQNPLDIVADQFSETTRVICFDELHVSDITDAMLLGNLFHALFERNIVLVATSNEHPDELYAGGLQRERFLPAIELIKKNTEVVKVDGGIDFRFRALEKAEIYHSPLDNEAEISLSKSFCSLAPGVGTSNQWIEIEGRKIQTIKMADGVVWFDFREICDGPRGAADYIEIARIFQTVLISNVPHMDGSKDDLAKRFMTLIDEFYDRNVKLILSAEKPANELYSGKRLEKSFKRTVSRLQEMATMEYLGRQHITE